VWKVFVFFNFAALLVPELYFTAARVAALAGDCKFREGWVHAHVHDFLLESVEDRLFDVGVTRDVCEHGRVVGLHESAFLCNDEVWAYKVSRVLLPGVICRSEVCRGGKTDRRDFAFALEIGGNLEVTLNPEFGVVETDTAVVYADYNVLVDNGHDVDGRRAQFLAGLGFASARTFLAFVRREVDDLEH